MRRTAVRHDGTADSVCRYVWHPAIIAAPDATPTALAGRSIAILGGGRDTRTAVADALEAGRRSDRSGRAARGVAAPWRTPPTPQRRWPRRSAKGCGGRRRSISWSTSTSTAPRRPRRSGRGERRSRRRSPPSNRSTTTGLPKVTHADAATWRSRGWAAEWATTGMEFANP